MSFRTYIEDHSLQFIAIFKFVKGFFLIAAGIGAIHFLHRDIALEVDHWVDAFPIDPSNRYIQALLERLYNLDDQKLRALSIGTFFYAAVVLTEGTGLWLRKRWAEYFTILATASFVPLEIYEIYRRITVPRVTLLLLNLIIVAYLIFDLRWHKHPSALPAARIRAPARPASKML